MKYVVHFTQTVSAAVKVEASSPEEAISFAWESDDMPGGITVGAFGSANVDDGEWEAVSVIDGNGSEVWTEE